MSKIKNAFYNILSNDRRCVNCKNLEEDMGIVDHILISQGYPREPHYYKSCSLTKSQIKNEDVDTQNCVSFKRKYGIAPLRQRMLNFERWSKKQWKLHDKIITLAIGTALSLIAILLTYLLAKGLM